MLLVRSWDDRSVKYPSAPGHKTRSTFRAAAVGSAAATIALLMSGCSGVPPMFSAVTGQTEVIALPRLDAAQTLRDEVARADWTIAQRTTQMAQMATECESCKTALEQAAESAGIRAVMSGGVWEPWGDFQDRDDAASVVELPAEVADAPYQVGPLSAYMWSTAKTQLDEVATLEGLEPAERQGLASILAGRMASARLLADQYSVDLGAQLASLAPEAAVPSVPKDVVKDDDPDAKGEGEGATVSPTDSPAASSTDSPDASQSSDVNEAQSGAEDEATRDFAAEALVTYDCVRSTVLITPEMELAPLRPFVLGQTLNSRAKMLVREGTPDDRDIRCLIPHADAATILGQMLTADIMLMGIDSVEVRQIATSYILADVTSWVSVSPQTVPTTSILPVGEEDAPKSLEDQGTHSDDSPQS